MQWARHTAARRQGARWQRIGWRQTQSHFFWMTLTPALRVRHMLITEQSLDSQFLSSKVASHIYISGEKEAHLQPFHLETRAMRGIRRPQCHAKIKVSPGTRGTTSTKTRQLHSDSQIQASHRFTGWGRKKKKKWERQRGERKPANNGRNPQRKRQTERVRSTLMQKLKFLDHTLKKTTDDRCKIVSWEGKGAVAR